MHVLTERIGRFWRENPALLYGVTLLLGIYTALYSSSLIILPISLLFIPALLPTAQALENPRARLILALPLLLVGWGYVHSIYEAPMLRPEGVRGTAWVSLDAPSQVTRHYGQFWRYPARLHAFFPAESNRSIAKNVPFSLYLPKKQQPLDVTNVYQVDSLLLPTEGRAIRLKAKGAWKPMQSQFSLGNVRFRTKQWLHGYLERQISDKRSATFLVGILTGEFDDRVMANEFGRFGLQHVMAVSGFHFSLVAALLAFLLRPFFSPRWVVTILILGMTHYFLFIGLRPSVMRAWIAVLVALGSGWSRREARPLNTLGVALLVILLYDPLMALQIGFQFSFLATAGILLFMDPIERLLERVLPSQSFREAIRYDLASQHGFFLLQLLRPAVALLLAVHLLTIPFLLYAFHKFPLMGLLYNLFFPFLVSLSLLLLLLGFFFPPIHWVNGIVTGWFLDLVYNMPPGFDVAIRWREMRVEGLVVYLTLVLAAGCLLGRRQRRLQI